MKLTGWPNGFFLIDCSQEHNIQDIKVTHQVQGSNTSWDLMKHINSAILTLMHIHKHMEQQLWTLQQENNEQLVT